VRTLPDPLRGAAWLEFGCPARLFVVDSKHVQSGLRLQTADDPQPVPLSTPDEIVGEYAGVVVTAGDYVEVERVGAEKSSTLCGLGVFVEEPAEPVMPDDFGIGVDGLGQRSQRAGLFQGPMWPVSVENGLGIRQEPSVGVRR
jgi:hypothetical protein